MKGKKEVDKHNNCDFVQNCYDRKPQRHTKLLLPIVVS